jgi:hypothetical protein
MFEIMGHPALPAGMAPELTRGIDECLAHRPDPASPPDPVGVRDPHGVG